MSKWSKDVEKLKAMVKKETHDHIWFMPTSKKQEKAFLKKHENENVTIEMLKIYEW